jgi:RNA polymerase sigma-70 factor (ECF subfamily)
MKQLIGQAQSGDPEARRRLVAALEARLGSMARYYARCCREDGDDLLGEAWTAVFEALAVTQLHIGEPEQYLLKRARWRMLDYIKWARRRRCSEPPERLLEGATEDFSGDLVAQTALARAAGELTPVQQSIVAGLMRGQTWREVAQDMGCSSANVAYHVRQIRERCADLVEA